MDYPEVDYQEVAKNLATRTGTEIAELKYQNAQYESMLVALKNSRDSALRELESLRATLAQQPDTGGVPDEV